MVRIGKCYLISASLSHALACSPYYTSDYASARSRLHASGHQTEPPFQLPPADRKRAGKYWPVLRPAGQACKSPSTPLLLVCCRDGGHTHTNKRERERERQTDRQTERQRVWIVYWKGMFYTTKVGAGETCFQKPMLIWKVMDNCNICVLFSYLSLSSLYMRHNNIRSHCCKMGMIVLLKCHSLQSAVCRVADRDREMFFWVTWSQRIFMDSDQKHFWHGPTPFSTSESVFKRSVYFFLNI